MDVGRPTSDLGRIKKGRISIRRTKHLWYLILVLAFMLVAAVNYRSNAAWLLVFVLVSATGLTALHARRNLAGVTARPLDVSPVFAGEPIRVGLVLGTEHAVEAHAVSVDLPSLGGSIELVTMVPALGSASASVELPARVRGPWSCAQVRLRTDFPFGLIEARRLQDIELSGIVYPAPAGEPLDALSVITEGSGAVGDKAGGDDFNGHRRYQPGESQRHVDWKAHARGRSLLVKDFIGSGGGLVWCDWQRTAGGVEERLSQLARWIIEAHRSGLSYGLTLPNGVIEPAAGEFHYHRCLRMLASYGFDGATR
ncbi:MAG: DUF58 domain-containing protein [Planctomycetes bacterium]|nr:DUF58 domain-containing protein [Planctomycetota bacterium]